MLIVEHYSECVVVTNHPDGELHKIAILRQVHFEGKFAAKRYISDTRPLLQGLMSRPYISNLSPSLFSVP
jgi:hypothetical protein